MKYGVGSPSLETFFHALFLPYYIDISENTSIIEVKRLIDDRNYAPRSLSQGMEGTARLPDRSSSFLTFDV